MWTCPKCKQKFTRDNQAHSCNDKTLSDFLSGKSDHTVMLFHHFVDTFRTLGDFDLHPAKTMISFAAGVRFGAVYRLGKNFIEVALYFDKSHDDNLCFHRIAQVPGSQQYNHYFRMYEVEDLNDEVKGYLKMALEKAQAKMK